MRRRGSRGRESGRRSTGEGYQKEKRIKRKWNQKGESTEEGHQQEKRIKTRGNLEEIWAELVASTNTEERLRAKKKKVSEGRVGWDQNRRKQT